MNCHYCDLKSLEKFLTPLTPPWKSEFSPFARGGLRGVKIELTFN